MAVNQDSWFFEDEIHDVEPPPFLIEGILPMRSVNMLFGEYGIGKTFLALDLAASIASEKPWLGRATLGGSILYVASEGDPGNIGVRMDSWREANEINFPLEILFYTDVVSLTKDAPALLQGALDRGLRPRLVVIDTLAMALDENENDNTVMNNLIKTLRQLQEYEVDGKTYELAWLLIHHTGWEKGRPRGGSSMPAGLDYIMGMEETVKDSVYKLFHHKAKNSAKFMDIFFRQVEVGDSIVYEQMDHEEAKLESKRAGRSDSSDAHNEFPEWLSVWDDDIPFSRATYSRVMKTRKITVTAKAAGETFLAYKDLIKFSHKEGNTEFYRKVTK